MTGASRSIADRREPLFDYDDAVIERYPTIRAGVIRATGLSNAPSPSQLLEAYEAEQRVVAERLKASSIADLPSIAAWRRVFAASGVEPTRYRNAAEALLRRLAKHGVIPTIATLVDIGNLVSIRYAMPVAVFDRARIAGSITVRFATGTERFIDIGAIDAVAPEPGEVVFTDRDDVVCARRWCWRQSAGSATTPTTSEALFVVEGHHDTAGRDIGSALADLASLLAAHQPEATAESYAWSPATAAFEPWRPLGP